MDRNERVIPDRGNIFEQKHLNISFCIAFHTQAHTQATPAFEGWSRSLGFAFWRFRQLVEVVLEMTHQEKAAS